MPSKSDRSRSGDVTCIDTLRADFGAIMPSEPSTFAPLSFTGPTDIPDGYTDDDLRRHTMQLQYEATVTLYPRKGNPANVDDDKTLTLTGEEEATSDQVLKSVRAIANLERKTGFTGLMKRKERVALERNKRRIDRDGIITVMEDEDKKTRE